MMRKFIIVILSVVLYMPLFGKSTAGKFDFFDAEKPLRMTLSFDIRKFVKTKSDPENFNAVLSVITNENDTLIQKIKVKARGEMRRNYCAFPPIMLKFKDHTDEDEAIYNEGNIKLVTHCSQSASFENYVLKEYLAYKLYNLVTPYSFKTRLVEINYIDSENPAISYAETGFLIESDDQLAARNHAFVVENPNISQKNMDAHEMARLAFFNYMIGNTDWSIRDQHNVKVLTVPEKDPTKGIPVAYDFDYSGFVDTRYSAPTVKIPITYVTERYYMGSCYDNELLSMVIAEFESKEDDFLNIIEEFEYLSRASKKKAESYIAGFYKKYKFPEMLISDLNRTCRK